MQHSSFDIMFNHSRQGVLVFDSRDTLVYFNPAAVTNFQLSGKPALGAALAEVFNNKTTPVINALVSDIVKLESGKKIFKSGVLNRKYMHFTVYEDNANKFVFSEEVTDALELNNTLLNQVASLEKQVEELRRSNAELEQFAYAISHDLQEPLRMVDGFLQLLNSEMETSLQDQQKQYMQFALDGAQRMKNMVADLLAYSRTGSSESACVNVDCNKILNAVKQLLSSIITESGADLRFQTLPIIRAKEPQILQLFQNLISNSLKYNETKAPVIEIGCSDLDHEWRFFVRDNGIGIEEKHFSRIFQVFRRLHSASEYSGTGIGLALCKKIVENHGGRIWVESKPGKGSTFYFTISKHAC